MGSVAETVRKCLSEYGRNNTPSRADIAKLLKKIEKIARDARQRV